MPNKNDIELLKKLGRRIKHYRVVRGLSQKDVAKRLKVTWETVSRWENGKVSPVKRLQELAEVFDIPVNYLINDSDTFQNQNQNIGIPFLGDIPDSIEKLNAKFKKTLFSLQLEALMPSHSYAIKANNNLINLTSIPIDEDTILIINVNAQNPAKYYLYYDKIKSRFLLTSTQSNKKGLKWVANILAIILQ